MFDTAGIERHTIAAGAKTYTVVAYNHRDKIEVQAFASWSDDEGDQLAQLAYIRPDGNRALAYRILPADDYDAAEQVFAHYVELITAAAGASA